MYYLLNYQMAKIRNINSSMDGKMIGDYIKNIFQNTFILALDGDVDFKPEAIQLLVDRMKKDEGVAAACGRIHPIGSGSCLRAIYTEYQKKCYTLVHCIIL